MAAIRDNLIEALNACIERSNAGESLDHILEDYPELAKQLRLLMEAGLSVRRGRFQTTAVEAIRLKSDSRIREAINSLPSSSGFPLMPILGLLIGGSIILSVIFNVNNQNVPVISPGQEPSPSIVTAEATEISPLDEQMEAIPSQTSEVQNEENLNTGESTRSAEEVITIIEGPVDAVEGSSIFIYSLEIALDADNPYLKVIQLGDILRVEALDEGERFMAVSLIFTSVEVYVFEDIAWRDSGDCSNPPPAWAAAESWHQRCEGGGLAPATNGGNLPPLPPGCKYTGFGNNNITIKCD